MPELRDLPGIESLLSDANIAALATAHGQSRIKQLLRDWQQEIRTSGNMQDWAAVAHGYAARLREHLQGEGYQPVFNLTGTVIHTNLGRAVLSPTLWQTIEDKVTRPMNLEFDLKTGKRGSRDGFVANRLARLTGAEAATVVNNNAAALLLVLNTFAMGAPVAVSRGELIEIGGSFRLPEIMARSGCQLLEVGTTNRTHAKDYAAVANQAGLLLKVHPSNYHIEGFTKTVSNAELAEIGKQHDVPFCVDLGSGTLVDLTRFGLPHEPTPSEVLREGAHLVTFSGDKLLGSVQAGLIVGDKPLIEQLNRNPLKRALRVDKITLAALEATLELYEHPDTLPDQLTLLRTLTASTETLQARAKAVMGVMQTHLPDADISVHVSEAQVGSGALPEQRLPSYAVVIKDARGANTLLEQLRLLTPPVIGRVHDGAVWLDMIGAEHTDELVNALTGLSAP